jgi:hypothetical protein
MKLKKSQQFFTAITSVIATFTVYSVSLLIFLYVQGWRIDFRDQSIKQVGVLTVESSPPAATIFVNGESKGRTNKSTTLDVGTYDVTVSKDGYFDWDKEVTIYEEKSTPVYPYLIKNKFESKEIYQSDLTFEKYWSDIHNNHLIMLLKNENYYTLIHYDINSGFWSLNSTPTTILTINSTEEEQITDIDLLLSPSGQKAVLEIIGPESSSKYIIPTTRPSSFSSILETPLNLDQFPNYTLSWAEDENYLILYSDTEVLSYDLNRDVKNLILKRTNPLDIWSTDKNGLLYIFKNVEYENEAVLKYTLYQYNLDGSGETEVIDAAYFQNTPEYIENFRQDEFNFSFFTNSPECTQTIGKITDFAVRNEVQGLYIKTTQSTYWYDITTGKYITVYPYPSEIIEFSLDEHKILIKTPSEYIVFVFDKEEGDHTISIGSKVIKDIDFDLVKNIRWLSNSRYIQYEEDGLVNIADREGDNKTPLISSENVQFWAITSSRKELITVTTPEDNEEVKTLITSYTIQ